MLHYMSIVLFTVSVSAQMRDYYKLDDPCSVKSKIDNTTAVGVCVELHHCQMAVKLITDNQIPPYLCYRENKLTVSCCPNNDSLFKTGAFRQIYATASNNFIRNNNITCYYDGQEPMVCCGNTKPIERNEPKGCPRLPVPQVTTTNKKYAAIMQKCWSYQKYYNKCVTKEDGSGYTREDTCVMSDTEVRTIGGVPAEPREFPHMAVLGTDNSDESKDEDIDWIAGGALVSERFILTAAHALTNNNGDRIRYALLGSLNKTDIRGGLLFTIIRLLPHPDYDSRQQSNDIALVELDRIVEFSEFIRPLCLPLPGMQLDGGPLTVAGWGLTEDLVRAEMLQKVSVAEQPAAECSRADTRERKFRAASMICARGAKAGGQFRDTCEGDSGSPLTGRAAAPACAHVALGVVSRGPRCGAGAAAYTRVAAFAGWLAEAAFTAAPAP